MLFWPSVAAVGFLVLAALVVALGRSSTERYEFERNQVQSQRQQAAVPAGVASPGLPVGDHPTPPPAPGSGGGRPQDGRAEQRTSVGVATHPAGKRVLQPGDVPAWWLVDEGADQPGERVVAGPFPERIEAEWAALSGGPDGSGRAVYGVRRADGGVVKRQLPQERAWLNDLGDQLDRLPAEWDELMPDDEDEALVTLVVEVAAALVEAGLTLHDCVGGAPAGGVCLTPEPGGRGVLVGWSAHDRISVEQVHGAAVGSAVQRTLNAAVADCLRQFGFDVEPFGSTGCCLVPTHQA